MLRTACLALLLLCPCVDAEDVKVQVLRDGKPAKGATVQVSTPKFEKNEFIYELTDPVKVDENGKAKLTYQKANFGFSLLASHSDGLIGTFRTINSRYEPTPDLCQINLVKTVPTSGKLLDAEGKPIAGETLMVRLAFVLGADKDQSSDQITYQLQGLKGSTITTDDKGQFKFDSIPEGTMFNVEFRSTKFGNGSFRMATGKSLDIKLQAAGSIKLVYDHADAKPADWALNLQQAVIVDTKPGSVLGRYNPEEGKQPGEFVGVVPGSFSLQLSRKGSSPRIPELPQTIEVKPGEQTVVNIKTTPAAILTGKLVEKGTDKGLAGISIQLQGMKKRSYERAATDKDGTYTIAVAGDDDYLLYLGETLIVGDRYFLRPKPDPKEGPRNNSLVPKATVKPGDKHEFPTLELREALTIRGQVVRADGKAIVGPCELFFAVQGFYEMTNNLTWDGDKFTLKGMPQDTGLTLRARSGKAVNVPEVIDAEKLKEPVTLTISEANSVSLTGKIIDLKERGLNGVKVELEWSRSIEGSEGSSTHTMVATTKTDANGEYLFTGMWPNERYFVSAEDPRFGKAGGDFNKTRRADNGETIEYDTFTVKVAEAAITGTVLHVDGTPVAGATVQTTGDTPKTMTTTTDANGKFEIKNLPSTKLFVTATKVGYRHTYVACDTAKGTAALVLRKQTEDPAPMKSEDLEAKRKNSTHEMLELLWVTRANHNWGPSAFGYAMRFDEKLAKKWIDEAPPKEAEGLKAQQAANLTNDELVELAKKDVDAAINFLKKKPYNSDYLMCLLGEDLLSSDKSKSLKLAEAALAVTRSQKQTTKGRYGASIARAASLLHRAGNEAEAKKLFTEALALVDEGEKDPEDQYSRSWVAEQLGKVDFPAALEQFKKVKESGYHNRALLNILRYQAKTKPQQAIDNIKYFRNDGGVIDGDMQVHVALAVVELEPAKAIKVVEVIPNASRRVRGYMELAKRLYRKNETIAKGLIDKAFEAMDEGTKDFESWSGYGGRPSAAAQVASVARMIGHPDVHSLVARTLKYRVKDAYDRVDTLDMGLHIFLFGLSVADPESVRWMLQAKYTEEELLQKSTSGQRNLLFILAMVDPPACKKAVEKYVINIKKQGFGQSGIIEMLGSLTTKGKEFESLGDWGASFFGRLERE